MLVPIFSGLNAGTSCSLAIDFVPVEIGPTPGTAVLSDDALNVSSPFAKQTIALSGTTVQITLTPTTLASGTYGSAYSQTITASGGTGPYTFTVASGSLPAGIILSPTGVLSGTPTAAGMSSFVIQATDVTNNEGTQNYTLTDGPVRNMHVGKYSDIRLLYRIAQQFD